MSQSPKDPRTTRRTKPHIVALLQSPQARTELKTLPCELVTVSAYKQIARRTAGLTPRLSVVEAAAAPNCLSEVLDWLRKTWPLVDIVVWAPKAGGSLVKSAFQAGAKDVVLSSSLARLKKSVQEILEQQQFLPVADELAGKALEALALN